MSQLRMNQHSLQHLNHDGKRWRPYHPYPNTTAQQPPILSRNTDWSLNGSYLCIYTGEPHLRAVHINIPYSNGQLCSQVFELSAVFRHICTISTCVQSWKFVHPITLNKENSRFWGQG